MDILNIPDKNYFTIGEAAQITGIKPYILRYWESEFKLLRPARRESGQRRYVRKDLETILQIKILLYDQKFSIAGAKNKLKEEVQGIKNQPDLFKKDSAAISLINDIKKELKSILKGFE